MVDRVAHKTRFFPGAKIILGVLLAICLRVDGVLGQAATPAPKYERILFLGNSITLHGPKPDIGWKGNWGMAASSQDKDYAHRLVAGLNKSSGSSLVIDPDAAGNIINIADIFERNYAGYEAARIRKQLDWKADLVVLQFGENVPGSGFQADLFQKGLNAMMNDIKAASNPRIYVTGPILGGMKEIDGIKRKVCAEDPGRRFYVDMAGYRAKGNLNGAFGHPGDKGMQVIADLLLEAMK